MKVSTDVYVCMCVCVGMPQRGASGVRGRVGPGAPIAWSRCTNIARSTHPHSAPTRERLFGRPLAGAGRRRSRWCARGASALPRAERSRTRGIYFARPPPSVPQRSFLELATYAVLARTVVRAPAAPVAEPPVQRAFRGSWRKPLFRWKVRKRRQ